MPRATVDPRAKAMTEEQLQNAIIDLAELNGWKVTFSPDWMKRIAFASMKRGRRRGDRRWPKAGLPDLICTRDGRLVVAELKSHVGTVKPEQRAWLDELAMVPNAEVYVWRPADWLDGTIAEVFR